MPWKKWQTFENIGPSYVNYVVRLYGTRTAVVFDDYHGSSTKDTTDIWNIRRTKDRRGWLVNLSPKVLIDQTALARSSTISQGDLIGEDTDLLILLLYHKVYVSNMWRKIKYEAQAKNLGYWICKEQIRWRIMWFTFGQTCFTRLWCNNQSVHSWKGHKVEEI